MYKIYLGLVIVVLFSACNKDKYTTEPQLTFKTFKPNYGTTLTPSEFQPTVVLEVRDKEGDIGFKAGKDTSQVYIKNTLTGKIDSFYFPNLSAVAGASFKAEIEIGLFSVMKGRDLPINQRPYVDTLHFEIYVTDFAKNKSNVILTTEPFIYTTLP